MFQMHGMRGLGADATALPPSNVNVDMFDRVAQMTYNFPETNGHGDSDLDSQPVVTDEGVLGPPLALVMPVSSPERNVARGFLDPPATTFSLSGWLAAPSFLCHPGSAKDNNPGCVTNQTVLLIGAALVGGWYLYSKRKS